jgi:hypothetical protein
MTKRYEDPNDPERRAAIDFGHTVDGETSWFLEDRQEAINLVERNGVIYASLQDFSAGFRQMQMAA